MSTLYTWGYSRHTLDDLRQVCQKYGIKRIYDVRSRPTSRRPEWRWFEIDRYFNTTTSDLFCVGASFLGNQHRALPWLRHPRWQEAAAKIVAMVELVPCLLLCLETDPAQCHRSEVAEAIRDLCGCEVVHL